MSEHAPSVWIRLERIVEKDGHPNLWLPRAALSCLLAYLFIHHLLDFKFVSLVGGIDLVIHEAGHLFLMWFGMDFLTAAGGTLFQIIVPLAVALTFAAQRDSYGVTVAVFWTGINLAEIGPYAADARAQLLPLVSPSSGTPIHDWHYLLSEVGLLAQDKLVGKAFHDLGILVMALGLAAGIWAIRIMARTHARQLEDDLPKPL